MSQNTDSAATPILLAELMKQAYADLRSAARAMLRNERPGHTLQATALVHEIYLRLIRRRDLGVSTPDELVSVGRLLMQRVLVDHGRRKKRLKRNAGETYQPVAAEMQVCTEQSLTEQTRAGLLDALQRLREVDARQAQVVELRFINGLSVYDTAKALRISEKTVKRDWRTARVWLYRELTR